jgi:putative glutamine amidotransferase
VDVAPTKDPIWRGRMLAQQSHPVVGVPACRKFIDPHPFHAVGEKYLTALLHVADVTPLLIPALGPKLELDALVTGLDGFFFTGSVSNVEPHHYLGPTSRTETLHDPERDATTLPLLRGAIAAGVPVLAVCRGHQELNVAFGGSLHQHVQEVPGLMDHREPSTEALDAQYAPSHEIYLTRGGLLAGLADGPTQWVNSLHQQGIDRLGDGLAVEAVAADGLVEAVRVAKAGAFALGVQWHPEWKVAASPFYRAIFEAFGAACRSRARLRRPV